MPIRRSLSKILPLFVIVVATACVVGALRFQHARLRKEATLYWTRRMEASADVTRASVQRIRLRMNASKTIDFWPGAPQRRRSSSMGIECAVLPRLIYPS